MSGPYLYPIGDDLMRVLAWASEAMRRFDPAWTGFRPEAQAIAHQSGGVMRAVAVYDLFSDSDCMFHLVSDGRPGWLTREFAVRALAYPFVQRRQRRLTCMVSEINRPSLLFTRRFGWTEEGRMRRAGSRGEDVILFGMLAEEAEAAIRRLRLDRRVARAAPAR
ncbi:hypothetical protein [Microcystis phage Mwe-JY25]